MEPIFAPQNASHWYRKPWGIVLLLILIIIVVGGIGFIGLTGYYAFKISQGEGQSVAPVKKNGFTKNHALNNLSPNKKITASDILATISGENPRKGQDNAKVTITMFIDFQCPFSQASSDIVNQIQKQYAGQVNLIFKHFPIDSLHPEATPAALAATCAGEQQKFWDYYTALFAEENPLEKTTYLRIAKTLSLNETKFSACLTSKKYQPVIEKDLRDGIALGVQGTPTYFVNDQKIEGVPSLDQWSSFILSALKK